VELAFHHQQRGELRFARELLEYILDEEQGFHWAQYQLAIVDQQEGLFEQARELLEPLLKAVLDDAWLAAAVRTTLGNLDWYAGDYESARKAYEDAYTRFKSAGLEGGMAAALGNLGMVANTLGDFETGRDLGRHALAIYRRQSDRIQEARVLHNLGFSYKESGDYDIALDYLRQAYALRTQLGLRWQGANSLAATGETLVHVGQLDEGIRILEQALEIFRQADNPRGEGVVLADLATAYKHSGRFEQARRLALDSMALALYTDMHLNRGRAIALIELARQSARQGDLAGAGAWLSEFDAIDPVSVDPRSGRAATLVRFRMSGETRLDSTIDQLLSWLLDELDQVSMDRAMLAAEAAEILAEGLLEHPRGGEAWSADLAQQPFCS